MTDYFTDSCALKELVLANMAAWGECVLDELEAGESFLSVSHTVDLIRWANDGHNLNWSPYVDAQERRQVIEYLLSILCLDIMTLEPINVLVPQLCGPVITRIPWQNVIGLDEHILELIGGNVTGTNIYDVPTAKRVQVADAIIAKVANDQQGFLLETDPAYLGKVIVDNRTITERTVIVCRQQTNPVTNLTEFCWYRTVIE